jgi:DNA-binding NarL/FixJ family response regulator
VITVPPAEPIRVALADDHTLFREGLRALFASLPDVDVVSDAADAEQAVAAAVRDRPHVLLMDIRMPGTNGVEAVARLRRLAPDVAVVMLTMVDERETLGEALRAGAVGYVLKGADEDELVEAVRAAARGAVHFGASVADHARSLMSTAGVPEPVRLPGLGDREHQILELLASGHDVPGIAATVHLSPKSVRNYLTAIQRKLGVADRAGAARLAREAGLGRR